MMDRSGNRWKVPLGAAIVLISGSTVIACLGDNICGKEMIAVDGLCVIPPDTEDTEPSDSDAGDGGDGNGDSEASGETLPGGMEDPCTSNGDCLEEADYCLLVNWPDDLNGICTIQNCNLTADDCPAGWECLDLAALSPIPIALPTACAPVSVAKRLVIDGVGDIK